MKKYIYSLALLCSLLVLSCGDDDDTPAVPAPNADFSFVVDGKMVTFTNTSADGATYAWDFGDGNNSTEASPSHTYDANGSYVAKLTSTNATGSDSKQAVLEIINVTVDGDFSDWDAVETSITASTGTVTSVKFENLENNKLFVYVEGTTELTPLSQIFLDVDNDTLTGAYIDWLYKSGGEDILLEGSLAFNPDQAGSIYFCEPCDSRMVGEWNWGADPVNTDIASFLEASEVVSIPGGLAYELAIDLTALGKPINETAIGIAILNMETVTWGPQGQAPTAVDPVDNPDANMFIYTFK